MNTDVMQFGNPMTPHATSIVQPIQAADPASHTIYTFTDVGALHNAIKTYGYIPVHTDGSPFHTQFLQEYGGYILDGAPINVWMEGVWLEGQKEAMEKYWSSGQVPRPPANILQAGTVAMPAEVASQTATYQHAQAQAGLFGGMSTGTLVAVGVGILAIVLMSGGKSKHSGSSSMNLDF